MIDPRTYSPASDVLKDRVILVTGASDGIGKAVAVAAAAHGARVILHGRNVKRLEAVYDEIMAANGPHLDLSPATGGAESPHLSPPPATGGAESPRLSPPPATGGGSRARPAIVPLDLEKAGPTEYDALFTAIETEFGRLDGLLHNAGMLGDRAPIEHHDVAKWMRTMHVNVNAPFILSQRCLPLLRQSADASIIFTSSGVVPRPRAYWGAYLASKWASDGLMRMLADELESQKIRVNSINPGKVRTNMRYQAYPAEDRATLAAPESIVAPYLFLLGPDSTGISGQTFDCQ